MVLSVTSVGDNAQVPGIAAETYIPDQLIAGNLKLVTDSVTITGGAVLKRGTVLGRSSFGSVTASAGTAFGTGTVTIAALPTAADTVTVQGTPLTFVAADPSGLQVQIGATVAETAANLEAVLAQSLDANLVKMTYSVAAAVVTLTSRVAGVAGNAYTLATSNAGAITLSASTLTGGVANTGNATVGTISAGPNLQAGEYIATCLTATTAQVVAPSGAEVGVATFGAAFADNQINFTITAGGTPCIAGDKFVLQAAPTVNAWKMAVASATDGSQAPAAVLADDVDATSDVIGGVYLMGEFNGNRLILGAGMTLANVKAALRPLGMFVKTSVPATDPL